MHLQLPFLYHYDGRKAISTLNPAVSGMALGWNRG